MNTNEKSKIVTISRERAERITRYRHPWIFSGAVKNAGQGIADGGIVSVADESGRMFAQGTYNSHSDIRIRVISWDAQEKIGDEWFLEKIKALALTKEKLLDISTHDEDKKNYRLVYAECDDMPGLVIDRYGLVFVVQFQTLFADKNRELWVSILNKLWSPTAVCERSEAEVRKKEGLKGAATGILHGKLPEKQIIEEDGFKQYIDVQTGQKTGYFLDLRHARRSVENWCRSQKVKYAQNYFGYTGSFNLYMARAGVKLIEHVDTSDFANKTALENAKLNGYDKNVTVLNADVFDYLSRTKDNSVDAIILDPPSFVRQREKIAGALEGYRRLNSLACSL